MLHDIWDGLRWALGLDVEKLGVGHMALRAVVVFAASLAIVRLGNKRFLGRSTAFDLVLGFMLGSTLSRAITGNAPFFPTLGVGFVLVGLHWLLAAWAFHSHRAGTLLKGRSRSLVEAGEIRWAEMRRSHTSEEDLLEALRSRAHLGEIEQVTSARLERSGEISVIPRPQEPRVVEVAVEDGVKTVRIELTAAPEGAGGGVGA